MKLITGGANQGKLDYAKKIYNLNDNDVCSGKEFCLSTNSTVKCIYDYQLLVKKIIDLDQDPIAFTKQLIFKYPNLIIILNEIGSGIIPIDKENRVWREQVGKAGCLIAKNAESVERIVCGIPQVLKQRTSTEEKTVLRD